MRVTRLTLAVLIAMCVLGTASAAAKKAPLTLLVEGVPVAAGLWELTATEGFTVANAGDTITCSAGISIGADITNEKPKDLVYPHEFGSASTGHCAGTLAGASFEGAVGMAAAKLELTAGGSATFKPLEGKPLEIVTENTVGEPRNCAFKGKPIKSSFSKTLGIPITLTNVLYKFDSKFTAEINHPGSQGVCGSALSLSVTFVSVARAFDVVNEVLIEHFNLVEAG